MLSRRTSSRVRARMPVAFAQPVDDFEGAGSGERDPPVREQPPCGVRQPQRPPAIRDHYRRDAHAHDAGGPAERAHRKREARGRAAGAEGEDDRVGWVSGLRRELEPCEQVADDGAGMRPAPGNLAAGPKCARPAPHLEHRHRQRGPHPCAHDERRPLLTRGGHRLTQGRHGLRELGERGAPSSGGGVHRCRQAVGRARPSHGDEHGARRRACEQELEPAHLIATVPLGRSVLALERQLGQAEGARQGGRWLQGRRPFAQATRRESRAYLLDQLRRIRHVNPIPRTAMRVATDYIRHAARAARKYAGDPFGGTPSGAPEVPDAEFYKTLAKALEEIAAGMEALGKEE